jgi:KUP system potassium uptake protein
VDPEDVTYYLGHETIVVGDNNHGITRFLKSVFAFMQRNSLHASEYFRLPPDSVVEIGREMAI